MPSAGGMIPFLRLSKHGFASHRFLSYPTGHLFHPQSPGLNGWFAFGDGIRPTDSCVCSSCRGFPFSTVTNCCSAHEIIRNPSLHELPLAQRHDPSSKKHFTVGAPGRAVHKTCASHVDKHVDGAAIARDSAALYRLPKVQAARSLVFQQDTSRSPLDGNRLKPARQTGQTEMEPKTPRRKVAGKRKGNARRLEESPQSPPVQRGRY